VSRSVANVTRESRIPPIERATSAAFIYVHIIASRIRERASTREATICTKRGLFIAVKITRLARASQISSSV